MEQGFHYFLFETGDEKLPLPVEGVGIFTSLEDARAAAKKIGRPVDVYRIPYNQVGDYVETVQPGEDS